MSEFCPECNVNKSTLKSSCCSSKISARCTRQHSPSCQPSQPSNASSWACHYYQTFFKNSKNSRSVRGGAMKGCRSGIFTISICDSLTTQYKLGLKCWSLTADLAFHRSGRTRNCMEHPGEKTRETKSPV